MCCALHAALHSILTGSAVTIYCCAVLCGDVMQHTQQLMVTQWHMLVRCTCLTSCCAVLTPCCAVLLQAALDKVLGSHDLMGAPLLVVANKQVGQVVWAAGRPRYIMPLLLVGSMLPPSSDACSNVCLSSKQVLWCPCMRYAADAVCVCRMLRVQPTWLM